MICPNGMVDYIWYFNVFPSKLQTTAGILHQCTCIHCVSQGRTLVHPREFIDVKCESAKALSILQISSQISLYGKDLIDCSDHRAQCIFFTIGAVESIVIISISTAQHVSTGQQQCIYASNIYIVYFSL